jgi:Flp pilus assembly protein TadD
MAKARSPLRLLPPTLCKAVGLAVALLVASPNVVRADKLERAIAARGLDPDAVEVPFRVSTEMGAWARKVVAGGGDAEAKLQRLLEAVVHSAEIGLRYDPDFTAPAELAVRVGRANCLTFAHLMVGLGREVGIDAYFLRLPEVQRFSEEGDLVVRTDHVTAGFGPPHRRLVLDFGVFPRDRRRAVETISDLAAIALYYSNRGAERIRSGEVGAAEEELETAVALDPDLALAWVNLGVARRRSGELAAADEAYRRALEVDPGTDSAYHNLASLLRLQGRQEEALELLALTDRASNRNPFSFLALGDLALQHGRREEARRYYRRAWHLFRGEAAPLAALGSMAAEEGRLRAARHWLRKARRIDREEPRVTALERRVAAARNHHRRDS